MCRAPRNSRAVLSTAILAALLTIQSPTPGARPALASPMGETAVGSRVFPAADSPSFEQGSLARESARSDSAESAQTPPEVRRVLDEVVVTATRVPTSMWRAPFAAHVVTRHSPKWVLQRTATDLLGEVPGVLTQRTSPGQGSPFLRGFTGFRNVHLLDGIRLNNSVFREGPNQYWNTIDPAALERVEVVLGPGAVAYGSDAIGGSLNAITLSPPSGGGPTHGQVTWRGASADRSVVGRGDLMHRRGNLGLRAGVSGRRFGDLEGGRRIGRQPYTAYDEHAADFKASYGFTRRLEAIAALQIMRENDVPRTHTTVEARSFAGTTVGTDLKRELDQRRTLAYIQLRGEGWEGRVKSFRSSVSWQLQSEREYRVRSDRSERHQGFDVGTLGVWAQTEAQGPLGRWMVGADYYRDVVNSSSSTSPIQGPVADDATYGLGGAFAQLTVPVGDRTELLLGERITVAAARADKVRDPLSGTTVSLRDRWRAAVGSARASWRAGGGASLYGGVSQGFRAPNLSDLSRFDDARTNEFEVAALELEPERTLTLELGGKVNRRAVSGHVAWFRTLVRDQIVRRPTGGMVGSAFEVTRANAGDGYVTGVEAGLDVRYRSWSAIQRFAWQRGRIDQYPTSAAIEVSEPASRLVPSSGALALRWAGRGGRIWAEGSLVLVGRQDRLSTADRLDTSRIPPGGTPGYTLVSLRVRWRAFDRLGFTAAVENLTDEDYRIHGSGSNEAGRDFVLVTSLER